MFVKNTPFDRSGGFGGVRSSSAGSGGAAADHLAPTTTRGLLDPVEELLGPAVSTLVP
jgi:hypothetical protein